MCVFVCARAPKMATRKIYGLTVTNNLINMGKELWQVKDLKKIETLDQVNKRTDQIDKYSTVISTLGMSRMGLLSITFPLNFRIPCSGGKVLICRAGVPSLTIHL